MTGEMLSIDQNGIDNNGEEWYSHAAVAKALGRELKPFDKYQGPYIIIGENKLWLIPNDVHPEILARWYNESNDKKSSPFKDGKDPNSLWLCIDAAKKILK